MDFNTLIETCYTLVNERQEVLKTTNDITQWQKESLHYFRVQLEPYIFNYLIHQYGHTLDEFWKTHQFPKKSKYAFVIVERRIHPNWWFVLRNIAWAAPHFSLYIFCSDLNYNFIKTILGDKADNVHIRVWFKGLADKNTGFHEYNITFQMPQFYDLLDAEYIINFQMDSYFLQKIPDWIFTGTYYGSPWAWDPFRAGNGGLAIRHPKRLSELCKKDILNCMSNEGEDTHISDILSKYGYDIPEISFRQKVFQENCPTEFNPIGTHQFWTYILNYNMDNKLEFSNNIKKLVTMIGI